MKNKTLFPKRQERVFVRISLARKRLDWAGKKIFFLLISSSVVSSSFHRLSSSRCLSHRYYYYFFRSSSFFWLLLLFYFLVECRLPFASLLSTPPFTLSPRRLATLFSLTSRSRAQKKDVFIVAPTGSGKSVCFHLIPHLFRALSNP